MSCTTLGCKSTCIHRDCSQRSCKAYCLEVSRREASHRVSTTETAHRNHPQLPLAPPPMVLPSMTGLAPLNMFVMPPLPIQLQINPALQATVPLQVFSAPLPPWTHAPTLSLLRTCPRFSQNNGRPSSGSGRNNANEITILVYAWVQVCH